MDNILDRIDRKTGMTVPPGYFDSFAAKMAESLPAQPWENDGAESRPVPQPTLWQRVRPFVYMAAMFAGIWCMMHVMDHISPARVDLSVSGNPVLTEAVGNDSFMNDYFIDEMDNDDIYEEMWDSGMQPADYEITSTSTTAADDTL